MCNNSSIEKSSNHSKFIDRSNGWEGFQHSDQHSDQTVCWQIISSNELWWVKLYCWLILTRNYNLF